VPCHVSLHHTAQGGVRRAAFVAAPVGAQRAAAHLILQQAALQTLARAHARRAQLGLRGGLLRGSLAALAGGRVRVLEVEHAGRGVGGGGGRRRRARLARGGDAARTFLRDHALDGVPRRGHRAQTSQLEGLRGAHDVELAPVRAAQTPHASERFPRHDVVTDGERAAAKQPAHHRALAFVQARLQHRARGVRGS
jgi:hypothetical protein